MTACRSVVDCLAANPPYSVRASVQPTRYLWVVSSSKPPHAHNADDSLSQCGGLPSGESTLQLYGFH